MQRIPHPRRPLDIGLSLSCLAIWAIATLIQHWNTWPPDLSALYIAARLYASDQPALIYAALNNLPAWAPELAALNRPDAATFPYLYPPIWAALAAPLSTLPPEQVFNGVYIIHIVMIAASVILAFRITSPHIPLYIWTIISVLLLSTSLIATLALYHNQLHITVTFLALLAFERYKSGAMIAAGTALALAAAIKILPALLGLIFILDKGYRAATTTAILGLALLALSVGLAGPALHLDFVNSLKTVASTVSIEPINWNLQSFLVQLRSLATHTPLTAPPLGVLRIDTALWLSIATYGFLIAALALLIWRTTPKSPWRLVGLSLILTLTGPLAWIYHYLIILLMLPMVTAHMRPATALALLAAFGWLTSVQAFAWASGVSHNIHGQAMLGTATMIALLALVMGIGKSAPRISGPVILSPG